MIIDKDHFDDLKRMSSIDYKEFIELEEIFSHYSNQLPDERDLLSLCIKFECIDVRVFDKDMESVFYRVKNNLFYDGFFETVIGDFTAVYDEDGNRIDEMIDIYDVEKASNRTNSR